MVERNRDQTAIVLYGLFARLHSGGEKTESCLFCLPRLVREAEETLGIRPAARPLKVTEVYFASLNNPSGCADCSCTDTCRSATLEIKTALLAESVV